MIRKLGVFVTCLVTLTCASPADGAAPMTVRVRPISSTRTLPHAFYDQAVASLRTLRPSLVFLDRERLGQRGPFLYSLVAWKASGAADRVELAAVAVNGMRTWQLEIAAPAAAYELARRRLEQELATLASPPAGPVAHLTLLAQGRDIPLPADSLSDLLWDFEMLLASCSVETAPESAPAQAFDLRARYAQPRALGLGLSAWLTLGVQEAHVFVPISRNQGCPLQRLRHAGGELGLGKCDGGATLALLCRPEIRRHAPLVVNESCQASMR